MPEERAFVLVVSGDARLRRTIRVALSPTGFVFEEAASGIEAAERIARGCYDLVLISLDEVTSTGLEICRSLRAASPGVGIVMICPGGGLEDEIRALEAGADDCVGFPFRFREIVGRLGAVLRRPGVETGAVGSILRAGDIRIDISRRICWRARNQIHLSPREFDLLAALMKHQERALTRVKLLVAVWGPETKRDADYLRSDIKALRGKIETDPANPEHILTVPWVGYMFCGRGHRTRGQQRASI